MLPDDILTRMLGHDWRTTVREGTQMAQQNAEALKREAEKSNDEEA